MQAKDEAAKYFYQFHSSLELSHGTNYKIASSTKELRVSALLQRYYCLCNMNRMQ